MKNVCALILVLVAGRAAIGCSDDGIYEPTESAEDAGTEIPESLDAGKGN